MTQDIVVGDRLHFPGESRDATVTELVTYLGGPGVRYTYPDDSLAYVATTAEIKPYLLERQHRVKVGDLVEGYDGFPLRVESIDENSRVWYTGGRNSDLGYAQTYRIERKEEDVTFEKGDIVSFKPQEFEVLELDDAGIATLEPLDGENHDSLLMHSDYFEFVRKPYPKLNSVWEDSAGTRYVVYKVQKNTTEVWITRGRDQEKGVPLVQFQTQYTLIA